MNWKILGIAIAMVLLFFAGFFINRIAFTGNAVKNIAENYTWTKALCDSNNECIDAVISCSNGQVVKIMPLLYKVNHGKNWTDPRQNSSEFCR